MLANAAYSLALRLALLTLAGWCTGCLRVRDEVDVTRDNPCTPCHGNPLHSSDPLVQSAPPRDLLGNSGTQFPGVGAHLQHLLGSETHGEVRCQECHVVPESNDEQGHTDSAAPAELVFGALARQGDRTPDYDFAARRCSESYCHGEFTPVWTRPRASAEACGSCHGLPPEPPHPQSSRCEVCHESSLGGRAISLVALHVDGELQFEEPACDACHGSPDNPAPPTAVDGSRDSAAVGAHQAHLSGGQASRPVACEDCHVVPRSVQEDQHPRGGEGHLTFSGVARAFDSLPDWEPSTRTCNESWCHQPGDSSSAPPVWTAPGPLACTDCHGMPPAAPHPQAQACELCHAEVYSADPVGILDRDRHIDGRVDVLVPEDCTACHGSNSPAPPPDLSGSSATTDLGVGAHDAHLVGRGLARPVLCEECHQLPDTTLAAGHVDSPLPAEVIFSGVARRFEAEPSYAAGTCAATYCHGDSFIGARDSGGQDTQPRWNLVDGSQVQCDSCHGQPPPLPHPEDANCSSCHFNIDAALQFIEPGRHVDGIVTFFLE